MTDGGKYDSNDSGLDERDEQFSRLIHDSLAELDAPPAALVAAAKESFTWRSIDAELAALTFDSSEDDALAGVRGTTVARSLSFEVRDVVVDVEVTEVDDHRELLGQVSPDGTSSLVLDRLGQHEAISIDALGRFRLDGVRPGPVRFVVTRAEGVVHTEWVIL